MATKDGFLLIIAIVDSGFTDLVMDAARSKGARGGTVINARGTGNIEMAKKYNIVITPEKEVILILSRKDIADDVLLAINEACGIEKKGRGIAFSIPVKDVSGIKLPNDISELTKEENN